MRKWLVFIMTAVLFPGGLHPISARAANFPYALSVTPFAGGYAFEGNQHITNRPVYGIAVGYNVTEHWGLEAAYTAVPDAKTTSSNQTGAPAGVETRITVHGVRGDILYHFFPDQRLVPYVAAGGGVLLIAPQDRPTNGDILVDYGAGLKFFLTDRIALRADVRHIFDITYHDTVRPRDFYNNLAYTGGVTFQLGGVKPTARAVPEEKPAPEAAAAAPAPAPEPVPSPAPAPVPPPAPAPVAAPAKPEEVPAVPSAETVKAEQVTITGIAVRRSAVEITATGRIGAYKVFTLTRPSRLVIDIDKAVNGFGAKRVPVHTYGIAAVRLGSYPDHLRIVLDAEHEKLPSYRITETGKGLKVDLTSP